MSAFAGILLDSNIIIYAAAQAVHPPLNQFIAQQPAFVSAISYVEVLGYTRLTPALKADLEAFFAASNVLPINQPVLDGAVRLRQQRRMSLGDAIIAATALLRGLPLATRNTRDFAHVAGLALIDPLSP